MLNKLEFEWRWKPLALAIIAVRIFPFLAFGNLPRLTDVDFVDGRIAETTASGALFSKASEATNSASHLEGRVQEYLERAKKGEATAQLELALAYMTNSAIRRSPFEAAMWCRKAADQGIPDAQVLMGQMLEHGYGVESNSATAVHWYQKAAAQGDAGALYNLGLSYAHAEGVKRDFPKSLEMYQQAVAKGYLPAMHNLGMAYLEGRGLNTNVEQAIIWFKRAAAGGLLESQRALGTLYAGGTGALTNYSEALRWFKQAAQSGDPPSQNSYGWMLKQGLGTKPDSAGGWAWIQRSASNGCTKAQGNVGTALVVGAVGMTTNTVEGVKWLRRAAVEEDANALYVLGWCYANGRGQKQDLAEAMRLYSVAATRGSPGAMVNLALEHASGRAVPKDERKSFEWAMKAAQLGFTQGQYLVAVDYSIGGAFVKRDAGLAIKWLKAAAEQGYALAQIRLGWSYAAGDSVQQDFVAATHWLKLAVDQKDPRAFTALALVLLKRGQTERELKEAATYAREAAVAGWPFGEYLWAELLSGYHGLPADMHEARRWFAKAADHKLVEAQFKLALMYLNGTGGEARPELAFPLLKEAAEHGHPLACDQVATMYWKGAGVKASEVEAFEWYKKAAEAGDLRAQMMLSQFYRLGTGTPKDEAKGLDWCQRAADGGWPQSQYALGRMYAVGEAGLQKDMVEALRWFRLAADHGDPNGQNAVGMSRIHGWGAPYDPAEAVKWFARAARQGQPAAQNSYGYALANGLGIQTNAVEAYKWLSLALAQKDPQARVNFPALKARLSPAEVEEGDKQAMDFRPKLENPNLMTAPKLDFLLRNVLNDNYNEMDL